MTPALGDTRVARNTLPPLSVSVTRCPNPRVVPSTTATLRVPPPPANSTGSTTIAPKNSGPMSAENQNHLLRTRSTNSRRTTAHTLCIGPRLLPRRRGTDQVDEDLVERRLHQLESRQPRPRAHQRGENPLGVRARRELHLGVLPVVVHLGHQPSVREHLRRRPGAAVEPDDEMVTKVDDYG